MSMDEQTRWDIVNYRCQKAHLLMRDVDVLMEHKMWNSTVNRLYYACFHIVSALLILYKIEAKTHMGIRQAFGANFIKNGILEPECGRIFTRLYDKRQSSDYDDFREFTEEEVEVLYPQAQRLLKEINQLINSQRDKV